MAEKTIKNKEDNMREMQQRYLELQIIDQQIKQIQKQVQNADSQIIELNNTKACVDDLKNAKIGSEILIPLSQGIFFEGTLKDNEEFRVNIGADAVVIKSSEETKKLIDGQIREVNAVREQMILNLQELILQAQVIQKDLEKLSE